MELHCKRGNPRNLQTEPKPFGPASKAAMKLNSAMQPFRHNAGYPKGLPHGPWNDSRASSRLTPPHCPPHHPLFGSP